MVQADGLTIGADGGNLGVAGLMFGNGGGEVNVGDEESKSGVAFEECIGLIKGISALDNVHIKGLMAIPPIGCGEDTFEKMHELYLKIGEMQIKGVDMDILSMGMSGDYELAIKHGSNLVRIGTKLFGARKYFGG